MSSPRHLWSGDWQDESAAAAEELARRRAGSMLPPPDPEPQPVRQPRQPRRRRRHRRPLATLLVIAVVTLLSAGAAFAVTDYLVGSGGASSHTAAGIHAWLGVHMENSSQGGVAVTSVAPNSPADAAGMVTGDVITSINNQPVQTVGAVNAALDGLVPGNTVQLQFYRAGATYSTIATLAPLPHGGP